MYRGAFGCHAAAVLRRLRRVCWRAYGTAPTFAVTSATSADPAAHARALLGVDEVALVATDGSPHGPRLFAMWNPPLTGPSINRQKHAQAAAEAHANEPPAEAGAATGGDWSHTEGRKRGREAKQRKAEAAREALRARNLARSGALS